MGDFANTLVPLRDQPLTRGDIVYEQVTWGDGQSKLNRLRVLRVDRAAAFCEYFDRRRKARLIPFHQLRMEPKETPSQPPPQLRMEPQGAPRMRLVLPPPPSEPAPAPPKRTVASDLEAWLEMGRGLIDEAHAEKRDLEAQRALVSAELAAIDDQHRSRIEALEKELFEARGAYQEARRYPASRMQHITERLEKIIALDTLRKLVGT
jgi:hypothetical protein